MNSNILYCHCLEIGKSDSSWAIAIPLFTAVFAFIGNIIYKEISRKREIIEKIYTEIYANCDKMLNAALLGNQHTLIYRAFSFSYSQSIPLKNVITVEQNRQKEIGINYDLEMAFKFLEYSKEDLKSFNNALIELTKNMHLITKYTNKDTGDKFYDLLIKEDNVQMTIIKDYTNIFNKPNLTDEEFQRIYKNEFDNIPKLVYMGELGKKLKAIKELVLPPRY